MALKGLSPVGHSHLTPDERRCKEKSSSHATIIGTSNTLEISGLIVTSMRQPAKPQAIWRTGRRREFARGITEVYVDGTRPFSFPAYSEDFEMPAYSFRFSVVVLLLFVSWA